MLMQDGCLPGRVFAHQRGQHLSSGEKHRGQTSFRNFEEFFENYEISTNLLLASRPK